MQSVVKPSFTTLLHDSPLNRPTVFTNANLIYKNFNGNVNERYFGYSMNNGNDSNVGGNLNIVGDRDEEHGARKETISQRIKTYKNSEPKDSNGETFRNKTIKRYGYVKSKVDSNLQSVDAKRDSDRKTRDGREDDTIDHHQLIGRDARIHNDVVWRVLPPVDQQHNEEAVRKQRLRSFSASPHVHNLSKAGEPTKSLLLPYRSRSASTHDFRDTSIDMLLPSNFDSYVNQSELYQDSGNLSSSFRFYRSYMKNKKIADNLPMETKQQTYNSSSTFEKTTGSSLALPRMSVPEPQEPINNYSPNIQPTQNGYFSKKNYHSTINEQYQNYLKSRKQYFLRNNTDFVKTTGNEIVLDNQDRANEYNFNEELPPVDKGGYTQTNALLDEYLQSNKISPVENKTTFEFPSFKKTHELSKSWNGNGHKQQDASSYIQTRSRSNSHGSHTIPTLNSSSNNVLHTPAEQLKFFHKLSIAKSLPQIPQVEKTSDGEAQRDKYERKTFKNEFEVLPDLRSSKEKMRQSQLLSMSVPAYLNYSDNLFKKQTKQREPLPILKKKKRVRIALENNRVHVYTPEYS